MSENVYGPPPPFGLSVIEWMCMEEEGFKSEYFVCVWISASACLRQHTCVGVIFEPFGYTTSNFFKLQSWHVPQRHDAFLHNHNGDTFHWFRFIYRKKNKTRHKRFNKVAHYVSYSKVFLLEKKVLTHLMNFTFSSNTEVN